MFKISAAAVTTEAKGRWCPWRGGGGRIFRHGIGEEESTFYVVDKVVLELEDRWEYRSPSWRQASHNMAGVWNSLDGDLLVGVFPVIIFQQTPFGSIWNHWFSHGWAKVSYTVAPTIFDNNVTGVGRDDDGLMAVVEEANYEEDIVWGGYACLDQMGGHDTCFNAQLDERAQLLFRLVDLHLTTPAQ